MFSEGSSETDELSFSQLKRARLESVFFSSLLCYFFSLFFFLPLSLSVFFSFSLFFPKRALWGEVLFCRWKRGCACVALRTRSRDREREIHARRSPRPTHRARPFSRDENEELPHTNTQEEKRKEEKIKKHRHAPELLNPCFAVTLPFSADKRVRFTDARTYALFFFTHCHTSSEEHSTCDLTIFSFLYFFYATRRVFFFFS